MTPPPGLGEWDGSPWARVTERLRELTRGEYEIVHELGRGGMAAVFLANDLALERRVAIKVMSPALLAGEGMVGRFHREAVTVAKLDHPHIITIYAVRQVEELHFLVLKFVEGRSLDDIIRASGPLPLPIARALLHQVGQALGYAHRRGVVHRDIKPGNILVDLDGNAVVTDFGIAKVAESSTQTQTGAIVGTPTYISPEQCYAETATGLSDQYALGVVAYEMLTGSPPFTGASFAVMQAHAASRVPSLLEARPDCPADLEAAVMRMLAKRPEDRFPTMSHALVAMGAAPLDELSPDRDRLIGMATPERAFAAIVPTPSPRTKAPFRPTTSVAAIELVSPPSRLEAGDRARLEIEARDETGALVPADQVRWVVDPPTLAVIDATGMLTSLAPGLVTVTATSSNILTRAAITVTPPRVTRVNITAPPGALLTGAPIPLTAIAYDRRNAPVRRAFIWEVVDGRATLSSEGELFAEVGGQVTVAAEVEGVRGEIALTIVEAPLGELRLGDRVSLTAGESRQLAVEAFDKRGHATAAAGRRLAWSTSAPEICEVTEDGVLVARAPGTVRITVECEGRRATTEVDVIAAPSGRRGKRMVLLLAGGGAALLVAAIALLARGRDARETPVSAPPVPPVQQSGASSVATTPSAPVVASLGHDPAEVAPPVVASVRVAPVRALVVGETRKLAATALDSVGATLLNQPFKWSSSDTGVARVDGAGILTAIAPGTTSIVASLEGQTGRVRVTVKPVLPSAEVVRTWLDGYLTTLRARDRAKLDELAAPASPPQRAEATALFDRIRSLNVETSELKIEAPRAEGNAVVVAFTFVMRGRATLRRDLAPRTIAAEARLERTGTAWTLTAAYPTGMR